MPRPIDTIAALATPTGTSAIAVVRASGPDTARLTREVFGSVPAPRTAQRGDYRQADGALVDDVLFTYFQGPHSYTGEDSLEVSCHGNPFVAQKILEDLFARGGRPAEPGEFTQRAFLNGRMDLSQAEAVMDLIHARSERALAAANQLLRGALGRRMKELIDGLLGVLARVEAYIDFPDEDLPPEDRELVQRELQRLELGTNRLLATSHYGELLRNGIRTVIIGEPNAGKSSLLNRLVGRERAIVSSEPGTTRDYLEEPILLGPHYVRLIDTAGLNPSPTHLEKLGIEKMLECAAQAELLILVLDATRPAPTFPPALKDRINPRSTLIAINKTDLRTAYSVPDYLNGLNITKISALSGSGIEQLVAAIARHIDNFCAGPSNDTITINSRHADALTRAKSCLTGAIKKLRESSPVELLASDLRGALDAYGEIAGKIDNERMLDRLFATFCIGK